MVRVEWRTFHMILPERDFLDSLQVNGAAYEGLLRPSPVLSEVDGGVH